MERLSHNARRDQFGSKINRAHFPPLAYSLPWLTIILGSLTPMLPIIAPAAVLPPMGYLMLLGWRLLRPGLLPMWAGFPLGLIDDLFSGQPMGSGVLLFSLTMIAIELIELRFPWRGFWQDWLSATFFLCVYIPFAALVSGVSITQVHLTLIVPQLLLSIFVFPLMVRLVSMLDRLRLLRVIRFN